jgi:hypothetical protein
MSVFLLPLISAPASINATTSVWQPILPAGGTSCAKGGAYAFFFREGTSSTSDLVIEFEGGGACWDVITCTTGTFTETVDVESKLAQLNSKNSGVHDSTDTRNPFATWNHLFVPYCSADAHGGNATANYGGLATVHHFGRVNAGAALQWVYQHVKAPKTAAVIGCSAGSLGALIHAPDVFGHYSGARSFYFGDSYVGVITTEQFAAGVKRWDLRFSPNVPGLARPLVDKVASNASVDAGLFIVNATLSAYPKHRFASYTSNADSVQSAFFAMGGGNILQWTKTMRNHLLATHQLFPTQFASFVASGVDHCRSQSNVFYNVKTTGVYLYQWVAALAGGVLPETQAAVDCCPELGMTYSHNLVQVG